MRRYSSKFSFGDAMEAIATFFVVVFLCAALGAWWVMLALGNGFHAGMWDIAPGFWQVFSVTYFIGGFIRLYTSSSSSSD